MLLGRVRVLVVFGFRVILELGGGKWTDLGL